LLYQHLPAASKAAHPVIFAENTSLATSRLIARFGLSESVARLIAALIVPEVRQ
jgi:hypothetical protein